MPWAVLCYISLSAAFAQNPSDHADRHMSLNVVVTDKSGKPVPGLRQEDFTLLDNKQPQKILSFAAVEGGRQGSGPQVEVILLLDEVNAAFTSVAFERAEVAKFLQRDGGQLAYPVSIGFLSDSGATMGSTSRDGNALVAEMNEHAGGLRSVTRKQGIYGDNERFQISINALEQFAGAKTISSGRKLAIWISPGWPLLTGPRIELSARDQQNLFDTIVTLSDALRRANITLYSIDPLGTADAGGIRTTYYEEFVKGVRKPEQAQFGNLALQVLDVQSGGRVFNSSNDVAGEIARCIADASDYYVLAFDGLPGDGPNEYHSLEIKLDKPKLKALTRAGYYAQP
jgi:VWFA-related protein